MSEACAAWVALGLSFLAALMRVSASSTPFHAYVSILSSWSPRGFLDDSSTEGKPTPSDGGTNPGGGALIADGAMRECLMWARDERSATWMDWAKAVELPFGDGGFNLRPTVQSIR